MRFLQSALDPQGPGAGAIAELAWVLIAGASAIFVLVLVLAAWALFAPPRRRAWLAGRPAVVAGGVFFPAIVLFALLAYTVFFATPLPAREEPGVLRIEVTGHQWWWRVRYLDEGGRPAFETANEIHIPVGKPVDLRLASADVLHSFWVPSLAGKLDMIPGRIQRLRVQADREGVFRGQCAEYCGGPHAQMALFVVAEAPDRFDQWRERERGPGAHADELFLSRCAACHSVRGTQARGALGPDLTHIGSRLSLGAGILPNDERMLAKWIASGQHIKPGNLMPAIEDLRESELRSLAGYLAALR